MRSNLQKILLSPYHQIFYNEQRLDSKRFDYNIAFVQRINAELDIDRLRQAITQFTSNTYLYRCIVKEELEDCCWEDCGLPPTLELFAPFNEEDLQTYIKKEFQLNVEPACRFALFRKDDGEQIFVIVIHHILIDGLKFDELILILSELYQNLSSRKFESLEFQKQALMNENLNFQKNIQSKKLLCNHFWNNRLHDLPKREKILGDIPGSHIYRVSVLDFALPKNEYYAWKSNLKFQISDFNIILTVFGVIATKYNQNSEIPIAYPVAIKNTNNLTLGSTINTVITRFAIQKGQSFEALLFHKKKNIKDEIAHSCLPIYEITQSISGIQLNISVAQTNLKRTALIVNGYPSTVIHKNYYYDIAGNDLILEYDFSDPHQINFRIKYREQYSDHFITQLFSHFSQLLKKCLENPKLEVFSTSLLSSKEYKKIIYDFNPPRSGWLKHHNTIQEAFEAIVKCRGDKIACNFGKTRLTYGELNKKANQLAHSLVHLNREGYIVGICLKRNINMIIGMLGILKAGFAYLPLDPEYPEERIKLILLDSNCKMILTDQEAYEKLIGLVDRIRLINLDIQDRRTVQLDELSEGGSGSRALLRTAIYADVWEDSSIESIPEELSDTIESPKRSNVYRNDYQHDLAYVIYTSGTTGRPKGVLIEHIGVLRLVKNPTHLQITEADCFLQASSIAFDAATFEIWGALLNGATLHLLECPTVLGDAALFKDYLQKKNITILWLTVGLFNQLASQDNTIFSKIKYLIIGGEALSQRMINALVSLPCECKPKYILNGYGPTENTTFTTLYLIEEPVNLLNSIPIGTPLPGTLCYILDSTLQPVPIGVVGELYVAGQGLAMGYFNRPDLTVKNFLQNPFFSESFSKLPELSEVTNLSPSKIETYQEVCEDSSTASLNKVTHFRVLRRGSNEVFSKPMYKVPLAIGFEKNFIDDKENKEFGSRLYKTGDLARWLWDGNIEFIGRNDSQIKIRGFRIELCEIEYYLMQLSAIEQCVVLMSPIDMRKTQGVTSGSSQNLDQHIIAYYTIKRLHTIKKQDIKDFLLKHLPAFMVPTYLLQLEKMPLTKNGKLDVNQLQSLPLDFSLAAAYVEPCDEFECMIKEIWEEVLGKNGISILSGIFQMGAHSLHLLRIAATIQKIFEVDCSVKMILEAQTIKNLAERIKIQLKDHENLYAPIPSVQSKNSYPLSFEQRRLWVLSRYTEKNSLYNILTIFKISGELQLDILEKALLVLMNRHPAFRTNFKPNSQGYPYQIITNKQHTTACIVHQKEIIQSELKNIILQESLFEFDLQKGQLCKFEIYKIKRRKEYFFLINIHHIISDAWSLKVFFNELSVVYKALKLDVIPELPLLDIQYGDYSVWQKNILKDKKLSHPLKYWKKKLAGYENIRLPIHEARSLNKNDEGSHLYFEIDENLIKDLQVFIRKQNCTMHMLLLAVFYLLLKSYTAQDDFIIGIPVTNRGHMQLENILGFFVNMLPIRISGNTKTKKSLLQQVKTSCIEAYSHQNIPFDYLVKELKIPRDQDISPLFQVMFNLIHENEMSLNLEGTQTTRIPCALNLSKFDLTLSIFVTSNKIYGEFEFKTHWFDSRLIQRMSGHYCRILEDFVRNPDEVFYDINMLSKEELDKILYQWNNTKTFYEKSLTVDKLFEANVLRAPDAIALVFKDRCLTYSQLNNQANQLSNYIRLKYWNQHKTVLPVDSLIALYMDRSVELVIAILAVLKAGCGYVPIDIHYPKDRIHFMLKETQAKFIITHEACSKNLINIANDTDIISFRSEPEVGHDIAEGTNCIAGAYIEIIENSSFVPTNQFIGAVNFRNESRGIERNFLNTSEDYPDHQIVHTPSNLSYVLYTSGSTGKPKGVCISHLSLNNLITSFSKILPINPNKTFLSLTSYMFDIFYLEFFGSLCFGAKLILADSKLIKEPLQLAEFINSNRPDIIQATPSLWQLMIDHLTPSPYLTILCGGEILHATLRQRLFSVSSRLWNLYGPTETTIWSTAKKLSAKEKISIGNPISNTVIFILNKNLQPVPIGVSGEIYIGGDGLARGYLNNPELTQVNFIHVPIRILSQQTHQLPTSGELGKCFINLDRPESIQLRLYKTGDFGRWLENGEIEILGRMDFQVKLRGHRIELEEIESQLLKHDDILQCAVISNHGMLVAYYSSIHLLGPEVLKDYLNKKLPAYLIPDILIPLKKMPLTRNGKIDRNVLSMRPITSNLMMDKEMPRTEVEQFLADIFCNLLNLEKVGINDNFFDMGGHSINAVQLLTKINKIFNINLPLRSIFDYGKIIDLAKYIEAQQNIEIF